MVAVLVLWLAADEAEEAIDEQPQQDPYGVEYEGSFQNIEDGRPQLRERCVVVNDGIDIQSYGYEEANEKRQALFADTAGGEVEVGHQFN